MHDFCLQFDNERRQQFKADGFLHKCKGPACCRMHPHYGYMYKPFNTDGPTTREPNLSWTGALKGIKGACNETFNRFDPALVETRAVGIVQFLDAFVKDDRTWEVAGRWRLPRDIMDLDRYEAAEKEAKEEGVEVCAAVAAA